MDFDIKNYSKESLRLIYSEASEILDQTFISFREITNKSYFAIGIYFSVVAYCISQIIEASDTKNEIFLFSIFFSMLYAIVLVIGNLLPSKMIIPGCKPKKLIHKFYENSIIRENQICAYYKQRIIDLNSGIDENVKEVKRRSSRLVKSIFTSFSLSFVSFIIYYVVDRII